jgi:hypothetical protein
VTLAMASSGMTVRPFLSCGVTSTVSHFMGAWGLLVAGRA